MDVNEEDSTQFDNGFNAGVQWAHRAEEAVLKKAGRQLAVEAGYILATDHVSSPASGENMVDLLAELFAELMPRLDPDDPSMAHFGNGIVAGIVSVWKEKYPDDGPLN